MELKNEPKDLSNSEIISTYLTWCKTEKKFSDDTILTYWNALRPFLKFLEENGEINLVNVDKEAARNYLLFLTDKQLKAISQNDYRSALQSFFKYLVKEKAISTNPFIGLAKQKEKKPKKDVLSVQQLIFLIDKINDNGTFLFRDTIMFELFWNSGLRTSELSALEIGHLQYKRIKLKKEKRYIWIYEIKVVEGKGGKDRFVAVGEATTILIRKYLGGRNLQFPVSEFLFPNNHGHIMNRRQVYSIIKGFLDLSHTKKKGAHVLRHTYATMLLNNGVNLIAVQKLLGHSTVKTTTIYAKPSDETLKNEFNKAHPKGDKKAVKTTKDKIPTIKNYVMEKLPTISI